MPLHPQTAAMLEGMAATMPVLDFAHLDIGSFRAIMHTPNPVFATAVEPVARIDDQNIPLPGRDIPIRLYHPEGGHTEAKPVLIYIHGGGWVIGTLDMYEATCTRLANRTGAIVVSIDYRLAPEAKFPGPVEDCLAAVKWIHANSRAFGGDATRIAVAGDSAGANLAAVVCQQLKGTEISICHQFLLYPVTNCRFDSPSFVEFGPMNLMLSDEGMRWMANLYLPDAAAAEDPRASPLLSGDLRDLPGATILTAEFDPLRDEGEAYAKGLANAGVPVHLRRFDGQIHGFAAMFGILDDAQAAIDIGAASLREAFRVGGAARQQA